uniref:hypothetical protein n=1 Tax=Streptomyces flavofungini TaxID=68200 RepID=UPI0034DF410A
MTTSTPPQTATELRLSAAEARQVSELTLRLAERYPAADDERLLQDQTVIARPLRSSSGPHSVPSSALANPSACSGRTPVTRSNCHG